MEQVKIFPQLSTFYATEGPIRMSASGQHFSLSWIKHTSCQSMSWKSILISPIHAQVFSKASFNISPTKIYLRLFLPLHTVFGETVLRSDLNGYGNVTYSAVGYTKKGSPFSMCLWLTIVPDNAMYCTNVDLIFDGTCIWDCSINLSVKPNVRPTGHLHLRLTHSHSL